MVNSILRQDESGTVDAMFPNPGALDTFFADPAPETHCLQYIDPYGDTVFNRGQVDRLLQELEQVAPGYPSPVQHHIQQLIAFLGPVIDRPHLYAKFVGD